MSEVETPETPEVDATADTPPLSDSDTALARYRHRLRKQRIVYVGVLAVLLAVIGVAVGIAWDRGEASHTTLHTFHPAPKPLTVQSASEQQQPAWTDSDQLAIGTPRWRGTLITYSAHTVRGRDASTGAQTWYYTRTDRTVCAAIQTAGMTIAVFEHNGSCDEVSAFSSQTGTRQWVRTLDKNGHPSNGRATFAVTDSTITVSTPQVIYAIDPESGLDRWEYSRTGCTIGPVVLGSSGALFGETCQHPDCAGEQFCHSGPQLVLRDGTSGRDDHSDANPDRIKWSKAGDTDIPASADQLVSAINTTTHQLDTLDSASGASLGTLALTPAPASIDSPVAINANESELLWMGGVAYAVRAGTPTVIWSAASPSPPTVESSDEDTSPSLPTARITVPTSAGIAILDGNTGQVLQSFAVPAPPAGSSVHSLGTGFLVAAPTGLTAYR